MKSLATAVSILVLLSSCVSSKKFDKLLFEKNQVQYNYDQLLYVHEQNKKLSMSNDSLQQALNKANNELKSSKEGQASIQVSFNDVTKRYNKLVEQNKQITNTSSDQRNKLMTELGAKDQLLDQREKQLDSLSSVMTSKQKALELATKDVNDREQKLKDLQSILDQKDKSLNGLQASLKAALSGFSPADLSIVQKDGKLYTTLSQDLLFASGSKWIGAKGLEALKKFGQVIKNNQDIEINVEGHTDTDGTEELNWNLSADRAIAVSKVLIGEGVDGKKIVASGRAFYVPLSPNDTKEGKAKNRRTEIILSPKLNTLYNLISQ
ncbi:MAG TPA: OmpA family protein [Saprospiraceae bacterium]|nr:OmpA family protein [Saprospiraceae bacterium]